jgi:NAD(P)-dependent dehydrogenase (short-subunit alcohol dehydrogenase family)
MDFANRVAVVSGGASGIGAACAERLRAEGAVVSTRDLAHDAAVHCDVTDPASVAEALQTTVNSVGTPTLHVAAAGIIGPIAPFYDVSPDGFDRVVAVNLKGVFLTMAAVARAIIAAELDGSMVAISSQNSVIVDPLISAYSATKAAVSHMLRVAALDPGRHHIRVNAVGPGLTDTPMLGEFKSTPGFVDLVTASTPLGRLGTPPLVADGVLNVMRSDWITGHAVMVDGGSSLATARGRWPRYLRHSNAVTRAETRRSACWRGSRHQRHRSRPVEQAAAEVREHGCRVSGVGCRVSGDQDHGSDRKRQIRVTCRDWRGSACTRD